jgi:hypothetical protein
LAQCSAVAAGLAQLISCGSSQTEGPVDGEAGASSGNDRPGLDAGMLVAFDGPSIVPQTAQCFSAADCPPGKACCSTTKVISVCQPEPCPDTPYGPLQLCRGSVECVTPGDTCNPPPASLADAMLPFLTFLFNNPEICSAPPDGGGDGNGADADATDADATDADAADASDLREGAVD